MRTYSILLHDSGMYYIVVQELDGTRRVANEQGDPDWRIEETPSRTMQPKSPGNWPQGYSQFTGATRVCNRLNHEAERHELWSIAAALAGGLRTAIATCPWCAQPMQPEELEPEGQEATVTQQHAETCPLGRLEWLACWTGTKIR